VDFLSSFWQISISCSRSHIVWPLSFVICDHVLFYFLFVCLFVPPPIALYIFISAADKSSLNDPSKKLLYMYCVRNIHCIIPSLCSI